MDLRFGDSKPTDEERAAVDALLGPPAVLVGGRASDRGRRSALGPRRPGGAGAPRPAVAGAARGQRPGGLDQRGRARLHLPAADGAAGGGVRGGDVLRDVLREAAPARPSLHVCTDLACAARRAPGSCARARGAARPGGQPRDGVVWQPSPCLGLCERAPAAPGPRGRAAAEAIRRDGRRAAPAPPPASGAHATAERRPGGVPRPGAAAEEPPAGLAVPQAGDPSLVLLRRVGVVDPGSPRRLPRRTAGTRPAPGLRARPGRGDPRGHRRRGWSGRGGAAFPTGRKWQATARPARPAALPGLQRRRERAGHLQGPGDHGGRPVRAGRGDDDRGLRDRARTRATSTCAASTRARCAAWGTPSSRPGRAACSATTSSARGTPSTSRSGAARAPTSAARRPPSSTRSRATAASRAPSRRSRWRRACSASRPRSTTSRRWSTCCRS